MEDMPTFSATNFDEIMRKNARNHFISLLEIKKEIPNSKALEKQLFLARKELQDYYTDDDIKSLEDDFLAL